MGGITVERVARSFGDVHAVRDATFSIEPGHVAGLIGPNGSGKTTLLLMLATLLVPDAGSIRVTQTYIGVDWRPPGEYVQPEHDTPQEIYDRAVPSWFVGLRMHALLGAGALFWAWKRTEVPARRLAAGTRVA